jgi:hypothetical protein
MKRRLALALLAVMNTGAPHAQPADTVWPAVTQTARPWTRWWWPGNAVDPAQLTAQLEAFATAGIGGVEITPIYGAQGAEEREIPFLAPRWVKMLEHTAAEARRLGLGVDMATGTGWPFGGPGVPPEDGSSSITLVDGKLSGKPTGMKVKRAAPGGEGLVLDPYSRVALDRYLERFTRSLQGLARGRVRSQFHDSFEYYEASWSPDLVRKFREMHGYDIQAHAAGFAGAEPMNADTLGRIKGDYRRTLSTMHLEYVQSWVQWSHSQGFKARNQAHGSPGRLLDLYSAADIPETESFGASRLPIRGLRLAPEDIREDPDPPIGLIGRFASSAAHFNGRNLVSSEVLTWLRENFRESPQAAKPQLDRQFIAGINHVFYHGATYSPPDAGWPGWYFYAATQLNPSNPLWRDFAAMHAYVARIQSILQAGQADNDLLLYWPEADEQDDPDGFMRHHNVHENEWLVGSPAGRRALQLIESGYSPDFVSDAQIQALKVENGMLVAPGGRYRGLIVPATQRMDVGTLRALARLREAGAALHIDALPTDVPGFGHLEERRAELRRIVASGALRPANPAGPDSLTIPGAIREPVAKFGLWFTRRARPDGHDYFVVNATASPFDGWVPLGTRAHSAILLDPLSGAAGSAAVHRRANGPPSVYLQLDSGESVILRTSRAPQRRGLATWPYHVAGHSGEELTGDWRVDFVRGGEILPNGFTTRELGSWTELARPAGQSFSGTAHYRLEFDAPAAPADDWLLDLGEVRETARVTLNGRFLGTLWSLPMKVRAAGALKSRGNVLEIEVTNLPANRVRDLDGRKLPWKIMKDINLPDLRYQPLDASLWDPLPSGLIGPVRLVPLRRLSPEAPN